MKDPTGPTGGAAPTRSSTEVSATRDEATLEGPPPTRTPEIEGHRLLRPLGSGGMGTVFLAEDLALGRRVAIKVISRAGGLDERSRARFLREARTLATVEHPHVVRLYSFGESQGCPYIVMEYVEGETLATRIATRGRLAVAEALDVARQVALALEAAAERGVVHRDIKPSNILLDSKDRVRVADFGLAKASAQPSPEADLTGEGVFLGTPRYASPEQMRGGEADLRSDVYSLGIVLYEMLTGRPPFRAATPAEVASEHLHTPLPSLRDSRPELTSSVVRLVERMTEKDPERRPPTYDALRAALEESAEPVPRWTTGSPFRGLSAFDAEHAPVFFGRARAVRDVMHALQSQAEAGRAFVVVLGMSGSGKSSLLRAGLLPELTHPGTTAGLRCARSLVFRPGESAGDLFDGLASALLRDGALPELAADGTSALELSRHLREDPRSIVLLVKGGLSQVAAERRRAEGLADQPDARLAMVIDQMEELFTLPSVSPEDRRQFVDAISALARSGRAVVLAGLRSDFFARCEELPALLALKEGAGQYHLEPPTAAEIGQMIRLPARAAGLRFEVDEPSQLPLDDVLREGAAGSPGQLPLLEFALQELYEQRTPEGLLTHRAYAAMGGIAGALGQRAASVFDALPVPVQDALPAVFQALVGAGTNEQVFSRRYAPVASLSREAKALVEAFVAARLFVADRAPDGVAVVSVAHEALLHSWPRLRSWLDENRDFLRVQDRVVRAAALWVEKGRASDLLLAEGQPLDEARRVSEIPGIALSRDQADFIEASAAQVRRRRRARRIVNANSVVLLAAAAGIYSFYLWKVIPVAAGLAASQATMLPLAVRLQIMLSTWAVRLAPILLVALVVGYRLRRRIKLPEVVQSGVALAVVTGVALLLSLFAFLTALVQLTVDTVDWRPLSAVQLASVHLQGGGYREAIALLRPLHDAAGRGAETSPAVDLLLAEAYMGLGDDDNARECFSEARRQSIEKGETSRTENAVLAAAREGLAALEAEAPRLGILCLQAPEASPSRPRKSSCIFRVVRQSPASRADLRKGDRILSIDGIEPRNEGDLARALRRKRVVTRVAIELIRDGRTMSVWVEPATGLLDLSKGCDEGVGEACEGLGDASFWGRGGAPDLARARSFYERACRLGTTTACVALGFMQERGLGGSVDAAGAASVFERACDAGDPWACNDLGVLLWNGRGALKDEKRAASLLRSACEAGLPDACTDYDFWPRPTASGFAGRTRRAHVR